jgi:periplasmic copper chaperone A
MGVKSREPMKNLFTLILCLFSMQLLADTSQVEFNDGWIKQLPPVVPMRAGYVQIKNDSDQDAQITSMQSDAFESVEMHETTMKDGMMQMVQQDSMVIPAHGSLALKPGGKHIMLINPLRTLEIGDKVEVLVNFSDSTTQTITLKVKQ